MAVALLAVMVAGATAAGAQAPGDDAADRLGLEAVVGIGGYDLPGTWRPVSVTLAPDAPVVGRLLLAADRDRTSVLQSRDVEVGAGAEKRYLLLAPPETSIQVQVVDEVSGEVTTVVPGRRGVDGVLVGLLGGLDPESMPGVTLPTTDQRVTVVAVDDEVLDLGARALQSLGTLVVRQADLVAMPGEHRDAVASHVAEGAGLVVLDATDPELGLPWRATTGRDGQGLVPAPGAWGASTAALAGRASPAEGALDDVAAVAAGRGRLVVTTWDQQAGPLAEAGVWEHLVQPTSLLRPVAQRAAEDLPGQVEEAFGRVVGAPPSVAWLAVFFVVYVVVAGPVLGLVLSRRRRPEVAWVVLPVVTALFAGAAFLGASGTRPRVGVSAEVASWVDGLGTAVAVGGVRAPQAGQHALVLPGTGWDVQAASWSGATRVVTGEDTTVTLALPGQSFGAVVARRALPDPPPLDVEVAVLDGQARLEVTNTSGGDLEDLTVRLATSTHDLVDRLPAGETHVQVVRLADELPRQRDPFGDAFRRGPFDAEPGPAALAGLLRWGVLDGAPGIAWVTATSATPLVPGVGEVDGGTPVERGTVVAVGVTPPVTDDATSPFEVQRDLVAVAGQVWPDAPLTLSGSGPATLRFRLPAEGEVTGLAFALRGGCCLGGLGPERAAGVPVERCGLLEVRDPETGDLLAADDMACGASPPCPTGATSCTWGDDTGPVVEGEVCFVDQPCREFRWTIDAERQQAQPGPDATARGMQVWDHGERRWVDEGEVAGGEVARWLGPLGDVWVRATGEFTPLDLAPQGVGARLGATS